MRAGVPEDKTGGRGQEERLGALCRGERQSCPRDPGSFVHHAEEREDSHSRTTERTRQG